MAITNIKEFERRWRKIQRDIEKKTEQTPKEIARWGAVRGKQIAPLDTGSLVQAIAWQTKGKTESWIIVRPMRNDKWKNDSGDVRRYATLHHLMRKNGRRNAKSGDPHWLFTVTREARKKFRAKLRNDLLNIIKR